MNLFDERLCMTKIISLNLQYINATKEKVFFFFFQTPHFHP